MKKLLLLSFLLVAALGVNAQNTELVLEKGVSPHREIDAIYRSFSDAYRTLDVEKVANLYTEKAAYLAPGNDVLQGRAAIRGSFGSFLEWVKKENRTMTISFRIIQRKVDRNMAYDVGIYTLRFFKDGKEAGTGQGKFVVVALKETGDRWLFQVDGYSDFTPPDKKPVILN
jgi:uncharacterized protein (TIGR02246 family)